MAAIYRQEIMQDIRLFTSAPKARFYSELFLHLDVSAMDATVAATGCPGYPKAALLCVYIVMKCEGFTQITDLLDYLCNNLLIAHYKSTGQERLWVRNHHSAANLNTIAHISLLAVALAAVVTGSSSSYRCTKSVKRIA